MAHLYWIFLLKMVIFHSYVKLPEGTLSNIDPAKGARKIKETIFSVYVM